MDWIGSAVQALPREPVAYTCRVQRGLPVSERTIFWILCMTHRDVNEHLQRIASIRREAGPGIDSSTFVDAQAELLRTKCTKVEGFPGVDGQRSTLVTAQDRMAAFERMPPEIVREVLEAIQSWSAAREGLLGNSDSAPSGPTPPSVSESQSGSASATSATA